MQLRVAMANLLISATILSTVTPLTVYAQDTDVMNPLDEVSVDNAISNIEDLDVQLNDLYNKVGESLNIDYKYVKILHILAGGKAVYADKRPNIYTDETVTSMQSPFCIEGANTQYRVYQKIECPDKNILRPSSNYIPDAAYSVTYDIVQLMNERLNYDRGGEQIYFDSLNSSAKKEIIFTEAVMKYTGASDNSINSYYRVYEKFMYDKTKGENIVAFEDGSIKIKEQYLNTLKENGIDNELHLKYIGIILGFDEVLANNDNTQSVSDEYVLPYIPNYTSRENMMIAATCLIGKVRYVWGGGHSGMSEIDGINPTWMLFEQLYADSPTSQIISESNGSIVDINNPSFDHCIKPSGSWCPNHGASCGSCSFDGPYVYSLEEYIDHIDEYIDVTDLKTDKYAKLMDDVNFYNGIAVDTINGLDCSGYASWIYNQITDRYTINTVAADFANYPGMKEVKFGDKLLPGDVFSWPAHIVTIVGRLNDKNNVYVTAESTPNVLRFGVVYYNGASQTDIEAAKEVARQANQLIGGLFDIEEPHVYCMNNCGVYTTYYDEQGNIIEDENLSDGSTISTVTTRECSIGRLKDNFIDENTTIAEYDMPLKDMYAKDIIQYIIGKLPYSYISGYNQYNGDIFNKEVVATNLGISE